MKITTHNLISSADHLSVIQITDTHLFVDSQDELLGITTNQTFTDVLEHVVQNQNDRDVVFFTGDIAQTPSEIVYKRFKQQVETLNTPYFCIAGNHDNPNLMSETFTGADSHQVINTADWQFILLNSHLNNSPAGILSSDSINWLSDFLNTNSAKPTAVFLHHHPVSMSSEWIDNHMLQNSEQFLNVVSQHKHVKMIGFGHVHQAFSGNYKHLQLFASPSTSVQFHPESTDFAVDKVACGYRWYKFFSDGTLETGIERLHYLPENLQLNSEGY